MKKTKTKTSEQDFAWNSLTRSSQPSLSTRISNFSEASNLIIVIK